MFSNKPQPPEIDLGLSKQGRDSSLTCWTCYDFICLESRPDAPVAAACRRVSGLTGGHQPCTCAGSEVRLTWKDSESHRLGLSGPVALWPWVSDNVAETQTPHLQSVGNFLCLSDLWYLGIMDGNSQAHIYLNKSQRLLLWSLLFYQRGLRVLEKSAHSHREWLKVEHNHVKWTLLLFYF